ncbi:adenylosuccinate synthetase [Terrabacter sp. MAHUQ-38]|uniref:adenylosuccinate synthetase n=1 Tax=unclassified Terrabacter TaxID=2630222 RepID=UPI00165D6259|nr:adenylosuccinate synthetase [Terrabacter sp. MAHUQ-38]MBC9820101.1 adenylosuccinate synthetase [Terrabacter sp. MAHUQ-38]
MIDLIDGQSGGTSLTQILVALSGQVASGKSTLANGLSVRFGAEVVATRELIQSLHERTRTGPELCDRAGLQTFGDELDATTGGSWVADGAEPFIATAVPRGVVVIDSVRTEGQLEQLRRRFGRKVWHVHVKSSSSSELETRYLSRRGDTGISEFDSYAAVSANATEAAVPRLEVLADVVLDTHRNTETDVLIRCAARVGLLADLGEPLVDVLVGGEFGSEGKGNIAFYLAPEYDVLMRVGGPNAGHKVPTETPTTHRSLPSGSLANTAAQILIGPGAVINPAVLLEEIQTAGVDPRRIRIDPQAMVITDQDVQDETLLTERIGSTGQGVGRAAERRIRAREDADASVLAGACLELRQFIASTGDALDEAYANGSRVLLEGTQGTGLSLFHGTYPWVTSRDTTVAGVLSEAGISPRRVRRSVMVCRTYPIRVGGPSGPMGQSKDLTWDEIAERSKLPRAAIDERGSVSGNERRVAEFDWWQLRRASELNGATDVALTFADYLSAQNREAFRYEQLTAETIRFVEEVEQVSGAPVSLIATNFSRRSVIDRREWRGRTVN